MTLDEIDKRLDLLKEYIRYRTEWLAKYEGYHSKTLYTMEVLGVVFIETEPQPLHELFLLSFEEWITSKIT